MSSALRASHLTAFAAALALLTITSMPALSLLHGPGEDDTCTSSVGQHDAAAHSIRQAPAAAGSPHCAICHLWQSVGRFRGPSLPSTLIRIVDFGLIAKPPVVASALAVTASRPVRAPPTA